MNFDYHMHTTLSDGHNTHEEMVLTAIEKGFDEIGFSDHFCIKQPCNWAVGADGITQLEEKIIEMKEKYSDRISILFGIEVDYFEDMEQEIRGSLQNLILITLLDQFTFSTTGITIPIKVGTKSSVTTSFMNGTFMYFRKLQNPGCLTLWDIPI